jgi:hypothetical protein
MPAWSVSLLLVAALGCSDPRPSTVDAGAPPGTMPPDAIPETCRDDTDPKTVDFFGEACQAAPYPVNTACHTDDRGWCIDGVCRPMCASACPRCPGGEAKFAPAGACYCEPRT